MRVVVGIPARLASSRMPEKPLVELLGKPMIEHVYKRCESGDWYTFVATCDDKIKDVVECFGGNVIMTEKNIPRPGLRVLSACESLNLDDDDIVIVAQGDEPFIRQSTLKQLVYEIEKDDAYCVHCMVIGDNDDYNSPDEIKGISDGNGYIIYFSRSPIPSNYRDDDLLIYKQFCIFGYRYKNLKDMYNLPQGFYERVESIEMLRLIENHKKIKMLFVDYPTKSVDTIKDRNDAERMLLGDDYYERTGI